jgi:low affinity Fe/Cu permease
VNETPFKKVPTVSEFIGKAIGALLIAFTGIMAVIVFIIVGKVLYFAFKWALAFTIGG